ncbi:hypothetical protein BGW41_002574 [Actinomortierella wolfii]|nr:hypothetical protein BGW41_002574 [Actinomortierella wolfii]
MEPRRQISNVDSGISGLWIDVLVISRRPCPRFLDLTPEEVTDMFQAAHRVGKVVEREYHAGQSVPHVHVHIIPRRLGDYIDNDEIYADITKNSHDLCTPSAKSSPGPSASNSSSSTPASSSPSTFPPATSDAGAVAGAEAGASVSPHHTRAAPHHALAAHHHGSSTHHHSSATHHHHVSATHHHGSTTHHHGTPHHPISAAHHALHHTRAISPTPSTGSAPELMAPAGSVMPGEDETLANADHPVVNVSALPVAKKGVDNEDRPARTAADMAEEAARLAFLLDQQ